MKKLVFSLVLIFVFIFMMAGLGFSQDAIPCSLIDKTRDALFIEFERTDEKLTRGERKDEPHVILRLKNNSTCPIEVISNDVEYFLAALPAKPTFQQVMNRETRTNIIEGELVPDLNFFIRINVSGNWFAEELNESSDTITTPILKGGNSLLFAVPIKNFKKGLIVLVPFKFEWETELDKSNVKFGGGTYHFIWFRYSKLPQELLKKIAK
jgi:hypothetical protein